ncbi:MAG: hypothetical protein NTX50_24225, partial [Candidatus Sumerlaeota bacterium]|nr:hypothetical protein [Candidatus Sumerlaeota bacterium]
LTIIAPLAQGPVVAARKKRLLLEQNHRSTGTRPGGDGGHWNSGLHLYAPSKCALAVPQSWAVLQSWIA